MTKMIPKRNPRPGMDEYGRTPLHYAAKRGDRADVERLLAEGSDPNAQDDNRWTALHFAIQAVSVPCTEVLATAGADVDVRDAYGNTPLWKAVMGSRGDGTLINLLRRAGADPNVANESGVSPVGLARTISNFDVAQVFAD
jgi:ankyrin repeat protein